MTYQYLLFAFTAAAAFSAHGASDLVAPTIEVTSQSPVQGAAIDVDKVPSNTRVLRASDGKSSATPMTQTMSERLGSVNLNYAYGNGFQPELTFRGFTASPTNGVPQGFAVYQNGIRVNEAFGDTLNWDLLPDFAIDTMELAASNPVFGLNALGGAAVIRTKTGFTHPETAFEPTTTALGQSALVAETGRRRGVWAYYLGVNPIYDHGWRDRSNSRVDRFYGDVGYETSTTKAHLDLSLANNFLRGSGPTPDWLLDESWRAVNTTPGSIENTVALVSLRGSRALSDMHALDGNLYFRGYRQHLRDGNPSEIAACSGDPLHYCTSEDDGDTFGVPVHDERGQPVAVTSTKFPGEIDAAEVKTSTLGGTVQFSSTGSLMARANQFVAGAGVDFSSTDFDASIELGALDDSRNVIGRGVSVNSEGSLNPVSLGVKTLYGGVFATDTFTLDRHVTLTASARANLAAIDLSDRRGEDLNGHHGYQRINPSLGATYKIERGPTLFANYAEANRIPTAAELSCASPTQSCSLSAFFVADPDLQQVVSRTVELGARATTLLRHARLKWSADIFYVRNSDDIIQLSSEEQGKGYFQNVGATVRKGVELSATYGDSRWQTSLDYSLVDATFDIDATLPSPNNPAADDDRIDVARGDQIPNNPLHRLKVGADVWVTQSLSLGLISRFVSGAYLRGDESNDNPKMPGYGTLSLRSRYVFSGWGELFGSIDNVFDARFYTFGALADAKGVPPGSHGLSRAFTPSEPLNVMIGFRATL